MPSAGETGGIPQCLPGSIREEKNADSPARSPYPARTGAPVLRSKAHTKRVKPLPHD
jgi:hypothetical protein